MAEKDKKAFVLRISPALLKDLENWAADEFRSTNGQIEYLLTQALKNKRKNKKTDDSNQAPSTL